MPLKKAQELGNRIAAIELDPILKELDDISSKLQEISSGKRKDDDLGWLARWTRCVEKRLNSLRTVKAQLATGKFHAALFSVMCRFHFSEERANRQIVSDDPQKVCQDLQERIPHYLRTLAYGLIAHKIINLMAK
jgi:hypothetical protein